MKDENITEIESEVFSLINSISNLKEKYNDGFINIHFFQKAINNAMNGLLKINQILKERNISISNILEMMDFKTEFNSAIKIIKNNTNLIHPDENNFLMFKLPGIASEITSSFITLMDALKLESQNQQLIINLFKELRSNFKKFRLTVLNDIQSEIKKIYRDVLNNKSKLGTNKKYRELIVDRLYQLFNEFQLKLDINT